MSGKSSQRTKRSLSLFMAALLTVTSVPGIPSYAEEEQEALEKFEVELPVYVGCTYSYEEGHLKECTEIHTILEYEKDENVKLKVNTVENVSIEAAHVYGTEQEEIPVKWGNDYTLGFVMPDQNVKLELNVVDNTEKVRLESEAQSEAARLESEAQSEAARLESEAQSEAARAESEAESEAVRSESEAQSEAARSESEIQSETAQVQSETETSEKQSETEAYKSELPDDVPVGSETQTESELLDEGQSESEETNTFVDSEENVTETENDVPPENLQETSEPVEEQMTDAVIREETDPKEIPETEMKTEEGLTEDGYFFEENQETEEIAETPDIVETQTEWIYEPETDSDGYPSQGSIVHMEAIIIPYDTWDFNPITDFTNITYDQTDFEITYISDDINYTEPGIYSSIYRINQRDTDHMWYVLRPVQVSAERESETQSETEVSTEHQTSHEEESEEEEEPADPEETDLEEMESEQERFEVHLIENEEVEVTLEADSYSAGEEVQMMVSPKTNTVVNDVIVNTASGETIACSLEEEQGTAAAQAYSFEMPEEDVILGVESGTMVLMETAQLYAADEPKLTSVYFERGGTSFRAPSISTGGGENMKHVVYKYSDGTNVEVVAYCLQNRVHGSPSTGNYTSELHELDASAGKELRLRKALFYCYGGPGWGKTFSGINIQKVMKTYGLSSSEDYYYATHNIASYIYSGKYSSYLNSKGISLMKEVVNDLDDLPDPSVCRLSKEKLLATQGETGSIKYKAAYENTATVKLPSGVTFVNDESGNRHTGTVTMHGGVTFHLEADSDSKLVGKYTLSTKFGTSFEAYAIQVSGVQDVGFAAGSTVAGTLSFSVEKGEAVDSVYVIKESDDPNNWLTRYPNYYSLEDTEFTFYGDKNKTEKLGTVSVNANGQSGKLKIELGTAEKKTVYYQETSKALGHTVDPELHSILLERSHTEPYAIHAENHIMYVVIDSVVVKQDASGNPLAGAQIKVHYYGDDSSYTKEVTNWVFETGTNGKMMVSNAKKISGPTIAAINGVEVFPRGYYAFEEIKAPAGYYIDEDNNVIYKKATAPSKVDGLYTNPKITMSSSKMVNSNDWRVRVRKISSEPAITDDNDRYSLKGAVFGFYDESGNLLGTETTDDEGYTPYLRLENLPDNVESVKITVKEEKAPKGFVLNTTPKTVTLTKTSPAKSVKFSDEPIYTEIKIRKTTTVAAPGVSLADCMFGIFSDESCADQYLVQKMRTLSDGCTDSVELDYGTYWVRELSCPDTFVMNTEIKKLSLTKARKEGEVVEVSFANVPVVYPLSVKKVSSNPDVTNGNSCYSFKGAKFHVAKDSGMKNVIATLEVKDESGVSESVNLTKGTYYVREASPAPKGYKLSTEIKKVTISTKAAVVEIADEPVMGTVDKLLLKKTDYKTTASLAGAEFDVKFYGGENTSGTLLRTWKLKTIERDGQYILGFTPGCFINGDEFFTDSNGQYALPLGCITFQEKKAPAGFQINSELFTNQITEDGTAGDEQVIYNEIIVNDNPSFGGVIVDKISADFGQDADGDASFQGAVFSITSLNDETVTRSDQPGQAYAKNAEIATIISGDDGIARIGAVLQAGTYRITEKAAPEGYRLSFQTIDFTITKHGEIVDKTGTPIIDEVKRGGFTIQKLDADTGKHEPQGDADLSGAQFTVTNRSAKSVKVDGNAYNPGEVVMTLTTDEKGFAETGRNILPYGTYEVKETVPPQGYEIDPAVKTVEIRTEGQYDKLDYEYRDPVIRGGIRISKYDIEVDAVSGRQGDASLAGAVFTVTNESDHSVIVDGKEYAKGEVVTVLTTGEDGTASTSASALPYGTYTVTETKAPYGYLLSGESISKTIQIRENSTIVTDEVKEDVVRGGVKIAKWDQELNRAKAAQGAATLAGAEFTLTNASKESVYVDTDSDGVREVYAPGQVITVLTTDGNGEVETTDDFLPCGTYHVKETKVPKGYTQKGENLEWDFSVGGEEADNGKVYDHTTDETAVKNIPIHFDIDIFKFKDSLTSEDAADRVVSLEGIRFTIKNVNEQEVTVRGKTYQPGEVVMTITTDEYGFASTNEKGAGNCESGALPYGKYEINEVNCPEGLTPVKDFIVNGTEEGGVYDGKTYKGIYLNDIPMESRIRIRKADAETGKTIPQGATFQILDEQKQVMEFLVTYPTTYHVTEFTTNADGIIETPTKLPYGTYYLHEVDPPYDREGFSNGYVLGKDLQFRVDENNAWEDVIEVTYTDLPSKGDITITKTDAKTGEKIAGAVFAVFADEDIITGDGTVPHKKGEQIDVFTVNEEGEGTSDPLYLGAYHVQEIKAPKGYCLDTGIYPFVLTYEEVHKDIEVRHEKLEDSITNKPTVLNLKKKDIDGLSLDGITFELERIGGESDSGIANEKAVSGGRYVTEHGGTISVNYLVSGIYSVKEVETLPGYVLDTTPRYVAVDANGFIYESDQNGKNLSEDNAKSDVLTLEWINDYTKWDFSKVDVTGEQEVPGAELEIYDSEGTMVYNWTSTEKPHRIDKIPAGEYTLVEKQAPEGYVAASSVSFTVTETGEVQKAVMTDQQVLIRKVDASGKPVSGATLAVYAVTPPDEMDLEGEEAEAGENEGSAEDSNLGERDDTENESKSEDQVSDGNKTQDGSTIPGRAPVDTWVSGEAPHAVSGLVTGQTYELVEQEAPEGYVNALPLAFTVEENRENLEIAMTDKQVLVHKSDLTGEQELPGAKLTVTDADGNVCDSWISVEERHPVKGLAAGYTYTLHEDASPAGYACASDITFTVADDYTVQHVTMKDDVTKVKISKQDITTGGELPGASLEIRDADGVLVDSWISVTEPHYMEMLPVGTYTLKETAAPAGYVTAEEITFEVADTAEIQKVVMVDDISKISITKTDITGSKPVTGAELTIRDKDGIELYRWVTGEEPYYIEMLPLGTYTLTEVLTPDGYVTAETIVFEVSDTAEVQTINMKDDVTKVEITKTDLTDGRPVLGAELVLKDLEGNEIERWVTEEQPHYIEMLPVGKYTLTETMTPDGYVTAETITFEVLDTGEIQHVDMNDDITRVTITKTDLTNGEPVIGAELVLCDKDGNEVEKWISGEKLHYIEKLPAGEYTLTETLAPDGYVTAETVSFTVQDTGEIQKVNMDDDVTKVEITKSDITDGKPVIGAELVIKDKDGREIEKWVTDEKPHHIEKLPVGEYTLTETAAPDGYVTAETVTFQVKETGEIQKVDMKDDITKVEITKSDITDGKPVIGAELVINDKDGKEIEKWVTDEKPHYIEKLPVGEYTLTETTAPDGYATAETITFQVEDTGEIQKVDMKDAKIQVSISKKDITNDKELPGAKLVVKDEDGREIEQWISADEPHMLTLNPGKYTLTEITAPEGYEVAETIGFTVKDTEDIQHVKMYDSPKEDTVDLTGKKDEKKKVTPGTVTPSQTVPQGITVTAAPVKTGDFNRYLPAVVMAALGVGILAVLYGTRKKKDRKKDVK